MTTRRSPSSELPDWPRLLSRPLAAAYVGVSTGTLALVPVNPVRIGRRILYDRLSLDAFVDDLTLADRSPDGPASRSIEEWLGRIG